MKEEILVCFKTDSDKISKIIHTSNSETGFVLINVAKLEVNMNYLPVRTPIPIEVIDNRRKRHG